MLHTTWKRRHLWGENQPNGSRAKPSEPLAQSKADIGTLQTGKLDGSSHATPHMTEPLAAPLAQPVPFLRVLPPLSERQLVLLRYLWNYYADHRYFPTHRECALAMNLRSTQVGGYLEPLIKKGYVQRLALGARNITLTPIALERLNIPLPGRNQPIPASQPDSSCSQPQA